jgi:hypothetical protein
MLHSLSVSGIAMVDFGIRFIAAVDKGDQIAWGGDLGKGWSISLFDDDPNVDHVALDTTYLTAGGRAQFGQVRDPCEGQSEPRVAARSAAPSAAGPGRNTGSRWPDRPRRAATGPAPRTGAAPWATAGPPPELAGQHNFDGMPASLDLAPGARSSRTYVGRRSGEPPRRTCSGGAVRAWAGFRGWGWWCLACRRWCCSRCRWGRGARGSRCWLGRRFRCRRWRGWCRFSCRRRWG